MVMKGRVIKQQHIFWGVLVSVLVSACSYSNKKELTQEEACTKLEAVIADHKQGFKQFKKRRLSSRYATNVNVWTAEQVFPLATACQVWEWSTGLQTYICHWQAKAGEQQARESYEHGIASVRQCLDHTWTRGTAATKSGGERAFFTQEHGKTMVSVRYFKEGRTILDNWQTTLSVGDASNLQADIQ